MQGSFVNKIIASQLLFLIHIPVAYAQTNLQQQFLEQKRIESENQKKHEKWRANVERERLKSEAHQNKIIEDLGSKALQDSVVFTCNEIIDSCIPQFRSPSGKCWGKIIQFKKGQVYLFNEQTHPSLWDRAALLSGDYYYDNNTEVITWSRQDNSDQFELRLRNNTFFWKSLLNSATSNITKYSCQLTKGAKSSIIPKFKKTISIKKNEDYMLVRQKLLSNGWESFENIYLDKTSVEVKDAINVNKLFSIHELQQCFTRGTNLYSCDTTWTSSNNRENPELSISVFIDITRKKITIEEALLN